MNSKLEDSLELAINTTEAERLKTRDLAVGYNAATKEWEVIIRYSGNLSEILGDSAQYTELFGGYAIVIIPESRLDWLTSLPEIEYVEKPKQLYFELSEGIAASCIPQVWRDPFYLRGAGTIVGIIDSGIDYAHPDFCLEDGTTRILELWDQERNVIYTSDDINRALAAPTIQERYAIVSSRDLSGHGTHVAGIAAGNGRGSNGEYVGVAPESQLIVVKLGTPREGGFPRTTQLMTGIDYIIRRSLISPAPIAVNISFGNNYGSHTG